MVQLTRATSRNKIKKKPENSTGRSNQSELQNNKSNHEAITDVLKLNKEQKTMLAALRKGLQTDFNEPLLGTTRLLEEIAKTHAPQKDFSALKDGEPVRFKCKQSGGSFDITKDTIAYNPARELKRGGVKKRFNYADAVNMVKFAALDESMLRDGIELSGNKREKALLKRAIYEVNESLPAGVKLKITEPKKTLSAQIKAAPVKAMKFATWTAPLYLASLVVPAPTLAERVDRAATKFHKKHPLGLTREAPIEIPTENSAQEESSQQTARTAPEQQPATSALTQTEFHNAFNKVVDHAAAGKGKLTKAHINDIFESIGYTGNKGNAYKQLSGMLDQQGITTLKPGTGRVFTDEFKAKFQNDFTSAASAGAPQPASPIAQAQHADSIIKRSMSKLTSALSLMEETEILVLIQHQHKNLTSLAG